MRVSPLLLTIVIPCYNEEQVLRETATRLGALLERMVADKQVAAGSMICFVDDGSVDGTWALIEGFHASDPRYNGIRLSRNYGHQNALMTGLLAVSGDVVISIDADLQDDIQAIEVMVKHAAVGSDIVYGVRSDRTSDRPFKRMTAHAYYALLQLLSVDIVFNHADFRLLSRRAIEALRLYEESNLFLRAIIPQLGYTATVVPYERAKRLSGTSKYTLRKMLSLALQGVTSFSVSPLRFVTVLGLGISGCAMGLTVWAFVMTVVFNATIPGWASTVLPIYLICGVQMFCIGIIGEYVGKIYIETKRRPRSHIAKELNPSSRVEHEAISMMDLR